MNFSLCHLTNLVLLFLNKHVWLADLIYDSSTLFILEKDIVLTFIKAQVNAA